MSSQRCGWDDVNVVLATYLAVNWSHSINEDQGQDYGYKGGNAGKGVDLPKLLFSPRLQGGRVRAQKQLADTDPYRPTIRTTPSDDIGLIGKGCEELPARSGSWSA